MESDYQKSYKHLDLECFIEAGKTSFANGGFLLNMILTDFKSMLPESPDGLLWILGQEPQTELDSCWVDKEVQFCSPSVARSKLHAKIMRQMSLDSFNFFFFF